MSAISLGVTSPSRTRRPGAREAGGHTSAIRRAGKLLLALLRELADENAYRRHLEARGAAPSPEEWRRFSNARLAAKYGCPKCC